MLKYLKRPPVAILLTSAILVAGAGFWALADRSDPAPQQPDNGDAGAQSPPSLVEEARLSANAAKPGVKSAGNEAQEPEPETSGKWSQLRDGDFWNLISEHWPRAKAGTPESQLIVHEIMSFCVKYRRRFEGKHLDEVQAEFSRFNDPDLFVLNATVWDRCGKVYELWDQFNGWKEMREAAAYGGQPVAMVWKGGALVSDPETFDEGIRWLESALSSGDPAAVVMMTSVYTQAQVDENLAAAWALAACKLGFDCFFAAQACGEYFIECGIQEHVQDVIVRELGDAGYYAVNQQAERIYDSISSGNVEDLDIADDLGKSSSN